MRPSCIFLQESAHLDLFQTVFNLLSLLLTPLNEMIIAIISTHIYNPFCRVSNYSNSFGNDFVFL